MGEIKTHAYKVVERRSAIEVEFLRRLVAGESQASIASLLSLGEAEALQVRRTLMEKLGASSTADLVREGIRARPLKQTARMPVP